jgi:ABC-type antimicrobial peptide transport system permease subunit
VNPPSEKAAARRRRPERTCRPAEALAGNIIDDRPRRKRTFRFAPSSHPAYASDPELAIYRLRTVEDAMADEQSSNNIIMGLFMAFAVVAVLLAASGLYGVMAFTVSRRAPEIAVRMALGASGWDIAWQVFGDGLRLTGVGVGVGLAGAFGLAHAMSSMLFGVTPGDPLTYGVVVVVAVAAVLPAVWIPARRAIRIDLIET